MPDMRCEHFCYCFDRKDCRGKNLGLLPGKTNVLYDCNDSDDECSSNVISGRAYQKNDTNQFAATFNCDSVDD